MIKYSLHLYLREWRKVRRHGAIGDNSLKKKNRPIIFSFLPHLFLYYIYVSNWPDFQIELVELTRNEALDYFPKKVRMMAVRIKNENFLVINLAFYFIKWSQIILYKPGK